MTNSATGFETNLLPDLSQVDGTAIAQEISVEHCVAFSPPGSRSDLWMRVRAATDGYGRRDMPGSRHRVQRSDLSWRDFPPSPIFRLVDHRSRNHLGLQKDTPDPAAGPTARTRQDHRRSRSRWTELSLRTSCRLIDPCLLTSFKRSSQSGQGRLFTCPRSTQQRLPFGYSHSIRPD